MTCAVRLLCSSVSSRSGTAPPQHPRISAFPCKLSRRPPRNQVKGSGNPWTPREKRRGSQASLIHDASEPCLYLVGRLHPSCRVRWIPFMRNGMRFHFEV